MAGRWQAWERAQLGVSHAPIDRDILTQEDLGEWKLNCAAARNFSTAMGFN